MNLLEPQRTDYDLNWRMFGIHIRVHPMFWLLSAILGWSAIREGIEYVAIWIACVFVSVLIHELGHVIMGRIFGADGHVVLYAFGGLAIGSNNLTNRWQRIAVSLAGPMAGFLYLGMIFLIVWQFDPGLFDDLMAAFTGLFGIDYSVDGDVLPRSPKVLKKIIWDLYWINLFWGLVNLLPVWPLDGGQVTRDGLGLVIPGREIRISLGVSLVVAGIIAVQAFSAQMGRPLIPFLGMIRGSWIAIMFALLAVESFLALQRLDQNPWREDW